MGLKGLHERRHQADRAKARARRKVVRWSEGEWFRGLSHSEQARIIGIHSKMRTPCSCWMCKRDDWEGSRSGLRAKADMKDQL